MSHPDAGRRAASYADLAALPPHVVGEIVSGELHATPRPSPRHAAAASGLGGSLHGPFDRGRGGPGGWVILFEPELHVGADVLVPDLAGWRRDRMRALPDEAWVSIAPDWVCEVVSPSTAALDRVKKLGVYARERVGHVWFVDPLARTLEVLQLDGPRWEILLSAAGVDTVRAVPFDALVLDLADLWGEAPSSGPTRPD